MIAARNNQGFISSCPVPAPVPSSAVAAAAAFKDMYPVSEKLEPSNIHDHEVKGLNVRTPEIFINELINRVFGL